VRLPSSSFVGTAKVGAFGLGFSSESTLVLDDYGVSTKSGFNSSGPHWYKNYVSRSINCEFCRREVVTTTGNQRICFDKACKRKLRAKTRAELYYKKRAAPTCIWCEKPILEDRKRNYHPECRAEKNRQRVKDYHKSRKPTPGPKKPRKYKGYLTCKYCKKRVKRTSARQFACTARGCRRARQKETKDKGRVRREQRARAEQREQLAYLKRLAQVREEKKQKLRDSCPDVITYESYRTPHRIASTNVGAW